MTVHEVEAVAEQPAEEAAPEPSKPEPEKMVLIAASGDLDKAWPVLILATTGAAYGMDVTVFFTFWGLQILKKPGAKAGDDWRQKMMGMMDRGTTEHLKLSRMNFGGLGAKMMKDLADEKNVASVQELLEVAQQLGVKLWPCQMTMDLMGLGKDDLIDDLPQPVGAGSAISLMKEASIQLFI
jgi:peroxiredoxin family protein